MNFTVSNIAVGSLRGRVCRGRGFTLAEILVAAAIIAILAALSLPAINLLTGSRSIEAATNIITATVSRARTEAISRQQPVGVAIYFDQTAQRTAVALVGYAQPWSPDVTYRRGDYVYTDETVAGNANTRFWWVCHTQHRSLPDRLDPYDGVPLIQSSGYLSSRWSPVAPLSVNGGAAVSRGATNNLKYAPAANATNPVADRYVSILPESEVVFLPPGVDAQGLNSAQTLQATPVATDRYLRVAVVFFDADGRLDVGRPWGIMFDPQDAPAPMSTTFPPTRGTNFHSSRLGLAVRFNTDGAKAAALDSTISYNLDPVPASSNNLAALTSALGVIVYDRPAYLSQLEKINSLDPSRYWDDQMMDVAHNTSSADYKLEQWLDENGTLLFFNQYTGTLIKAE